MEKKNSAVHPTAPAPIGADPAARTGSKTIDTHHALRILKDFYIECRKEFRKLERVTASVTIGSEASSLLFIADGFNLSMTVKEGGVA